MNSYFGLLGRLKVLAEELLRECEEYRKLLERSNLKIDRALLESAVIQKRIMDEYDIRWNEREMKYERAPTQIPPREQEKCEAA